VSLAALPMPRKSRPQPKKTRARAHIGRHEQHMMVVKVKVFPSSFCEVVSSRDGANDKIALQQYGGPGPCNRRDRPMCGSKSMCIRGERTSRLERGESAPREVRGGPAT
jgi:hypothetical protein